MATGFFQLDRMVEVGHVLVLDQDWDVRVVVVKSEKCRNELRGVPLSGTPSVTKIEICESVVPGHHDCGVAAQRFRLRVLTRIDGGSKILEFRELFSGLPLDFIFTDEPLIPDGIAQVVSRVLVSRHVLTLALKKLPSQDGWEEEILVLVDRGCVEDRPLALVVRVGGEAFALLAKDRAANVCIVPRSAIEHDGATPASAIFGS